MSQSKSIHRLTQYGDASCGWEFARRRVYCNSFMRLVALWPFACLGTEMRSMGVKTNKHPGDGARGRCFCQSTLCFHPVAEAHVPSYNQQPPSSCFPAVPSLQLPCICGAIPVRGGRQKYSLQSRGLELALYLLWDRLWTRQTYSYFC